MATVNRGEREGSRSIWKRVLMKVEESRREGALLLRASLHPSVQGLSGDQSEENKTKWDKRQQYVDLLKLAGGDKVKAVKIMKESGVMEHAEWKLSGLFHKLAENLSKISDDLDEVVVNKADAGAKLETLTAVAENLNNQRPLFSKVMVVGGLMQRILEDPASKS